VTGTVVTVAVPVLDGEPWLDEVLSAVRAQRVDRELELLVVDSGSTDRSVEIARRHGANVHEIPRASFSHGGTRNWMMELARGEHVAFLTQDATPASDRWLAGLLECFEAAGDVGLAYGPHLPRQGASVAVRADLWSQFGAAGNGGVSIQRLEGGGDADWRMRFFSDVNGCVARWAWERVPYRAVPYAEDQLLGRDMLDAGIAKAFNPGAAVIHSHDYPAARYLRRQFDEWRALREVLGVRETYGVRSGLRELRRLLEQDRAYMREVERRPPRSTLRPLAAAAGLHAMRITGATLGSDAGRLPRSARGALSLEGRDTFSPLSSDRGEAEPTPPREDWEWGFVAEAFPRRPLALAPRGTDLAEKESLRLAVVIPPWQLGSGGHMTIFRLVRLLEERGHELSLHLFDPRHWDDRPAHELRAELRREFLPVRAPLLRGFEDWSGADVALATNWWTAFPLRDLPHCAEKAYLVQDFEPDFHARSAQYLWAEETYRMGYRCIAATSWLAGLLRERYGAEAEHFDLGTDLVTYRAGRDDLREPATVALYARRQTERRGVDLALAALTLLKQSRPEVRVMTYGTDWPVEAPFELEHLGVLRPAELAALYERATVGVSLSLTNRALVVQEMMASGLPVVELSGANVSSDLGAPGELVAQAAPDPASIADAIERLLDDRDERVAMAGRARAWAQSRTWERAAEQVEGALRGFLAKPR
jgi:O-antigen biosynthesis protein